MLEDIEIKNEGVNTFQNEHSFFDKDMSIEQLREKKIEWMKNFVEYNGFDFLVKVSLNKIYYN